MDVSAKLGLVAFFTVFFVVSFYLIREVLLPVPYLGVSGLPTWVKFDLRMLIVPFVIFGIVSYLWVLNRSRN